MSPIVLKHQVDIEKSGTRNRPRIPPEVIRADLRVDSVEDDPILERMELEILDVIEQHVQELYGERLFSADLEVSRPCRLRPARNWKPYFNSNSQPLTRVRIEDGQDVESADVQPDYLGMVEIPAAGTWRLLGVIGLTGQSIPPPDVCGAILMALAWRYDRTGLDTASDQSWFLKSGAATFLQSRKRVATFDEEVFPL